MNNGSVGTISVDLELNDSAFDRALAASEARATAAGRTIDRELSGATTRTEARFASFGSIATKALTYTGVAAGVAGIAAVKMAGDFEQSLNVFQSVSGATAKQMELVAAKARQLGQDASLPGISARDAASALTELAKAGLSVNDSLAASKGVLSLAKAGNLDVADAATIAARALNSFGLAGTQAANVADLLAAAANASTAGVGDIGLGLAQVGAGAKQMGVSLRDTVASLALFSNAGVQGQDAGTSLKQMFIQLANPTKEASTLMKQLGLNFFDAKGNFVGLERTSGLLQAKLKGLTQEQRNQALATIFGSDSMRVAAILTDQGAAGFDKMAAAVSKQGAATELAAAQNAGFKGALDNFVSTLETIATDLGTKVLPPLTDFLRAMADKLPGVVKFASDNMAPLVTIVVALGAAFATVKIAGFINDLSLATTTLKAFIGAGNAAGIRAIGTALAFMGRSATVGFAAIRAGAITARSALITTGIGALVVALGVAADLIITHWDQVSAYFSRLSARLQPFLTPVGQAFNTLSLTVQDLGQKVASKVLPVFDRFAVALNGPVGQAMAVLLGLALKLAAVFADVLVTAIGAYLTVLVRILEVTNSVILKIEEFYRVTVARLGAVRDAVVRFGTDIAGALEGSFDTGVTAVKRAFDVMVAAVKPWQQDFKGTLVKTLDDVRLSFEKFATSATDASRHWVDTTTRDLTAWAKAAPDKLGKAIDDLTAKMINYDVETVKRWSHWIGITTTAAQSWGSVVLDRIGKSLDSMGKSIEVNVEAFPDKFGKFIDTTVRSVEGWGTQLYSGAKVAVTNIGAAIDQTVTAFPEKLTRFFNASVASLQTWGTSLFTGTGTAIANIGTAMQNFFSSLPATLDKFLRDTGGATTEKLTDGMKTNLLDVKTLRKIGDSILGAIFGGIALILITGNIYMVDLGIRLLTAMVRGITDTVPKLVAAGGDMIAGLVRGIGDNAGKVVAKIKEICASALNAVKAFFGIHSPSTVMATMGENLMKGLAEGIASAGSLATSAMTGVSADLQGALTVPQGNFNLSTDVSGGGAGVGRSQTFNNVYNVFNQADAQLIANETAWRAARA